MPSLSVVQTEPSRRRNDAPALSSPPKPSVPATNPSTNHLKPTGNSTKAVAERMAKNPATTVPQTPLPNVTYGVGGVTIMTTGKPVGAIV